MGKSKKILEEFIDKVNHARDVLEELGTFGLEGEYEMFDCRQAARELSDIMKKIEAF